MSDDGAARSRQVVRFAEVQGSLVLFAQALAARPLGLAVLDDPKQAELVESDGKTILLPEEIAHFASARENRGAYRIAVLRQIGYLTSTLDFDLTVAATRVATLATSSHARPATGAAALAHFFARSARPTLLRQVFLLLEDLRIATAVRRHYPGARADLERVQAHALARRPNRETLTPAAAWLEGLLQYSLGVEPTRLGAGADSGLQAILAEATRVEHQQANVYDSASAALQICAWLTARAASDLTDAMAVDRAPRADALQRDPSAVLASRELEDVGHTVAAHGPLRPDLLRPHSGGGRGGAALECEPAVASLPAAQNAAARPDAAQRAARASPPRAPGSFVYDEWDYAHGRYLPSWCQVHEATLRGEDVHFLHDVRRRHAVVARGVRQRLRFIRPELRQRVHRRSDGDELDLDGLLDAVIDRKTGHATDARLYIGYERTPRDVCAAFLVDLSASTDFPLPAAADDSAGRATAAPASAAFEAAEPAEPVYLYSGYEPCPVPALAVQRRVIDVAKDSLVLMCDALQALGDRHAIYGFSGSGREQVEFFVAKAFDAAWSARAAAAVAAMQPRRSTRTGAAIRHAITKLARQSARTRVLIIISDGYPEDIDYGPTPRDLDYGIHDTARALQEAEAAGIATFCIAIDPAGHDYLRRMCAEQRYLVITDVAALPDELTKIYRTLTDR